MSEAPTLALREACVLTVAILGGEPGMPDIVDFLARDGWRVSRHSVRLTLGHPRGAAVEIAVQGEAGRGRHTRWRLTEAARAWLAGETEPRTCRFLAAA